MQPIVHFHTAVLSLQLTLTAAEPPTDYQLLPERPRIQSPAIKEASGLAASPSNPALLWIVNDSGGPSEIHLATTGGDDRGTVKLIDTPNIDWEDLASFTLAGKSYLLVADTGDNNAKRDTCRLSIFQEPRISPEGTVSDGTAAPAWSIEFRYEGGPRDCEAVGVDASTGKILLISKRASPPEIYELPLKSPSHPPIQTARLIGRIADLSSKASLLPFHDQPTAFDISRDGSLGVVITYQGLFLFRRTLGESWATALARHPADLSPHRLIQAESVALSGDGGAIHVISEGKSSPIVRYQIRQSDTNTPHVRP